MEKEKNQEGSVIISPKKRQLKNDKDLGNVNLVCDFLEFNFDK
jgi:hypothetical protein